jgi:3'-phosphoadenosine 5'-phosphosulfate sulfotransferase (PAPS reductase)/FAD synthetase
MVLLDMLMPIDNTVEVFYLDTDFLFPETYHLRDVCAQKYGISPVGYKSLLTPPQQAEQYGDALWSRDPDQCCEIRKVEPNFRALEGKPELVDRAEHNRLLRRQTALRQFLADECKKRQRVARARGNLHLRSAPPVAGFADRRMISQVKGDAFLRMPGAMQGDLIELSGT